MYLNSQVKLVVLHQVEVHVVAVRYARWCSQQECGEEGQMERATSANEAVLVMDGIEHQQLEVRLCLVSCGWTSKSTSISIKSIPCRQTRTGRPTIYERLDSYGVWPA